jgi:hypothetical protein
MKKKRDSLEQLRAGKAHCRDLGFAPPDFL